MMTNELLELQADNARLREALEKLLITKAYKDQHGKDNTYESMRISAWSYAEKSLTIASPSTALQEYMDSIKKSAHAEFMSSLVEIAVIGKEQVSGGKMIYYKSLDKIPPNTKLYALKIED